MAKRQPPTNVFEMQTPDKWGDLTFQVGGKTMMEFRPDGKIFVRGEQVDDNKKVYEAFQQWLAMTMRF